MSSEGWELYPTFEAKIRDWIRAETPTPSQWDVDRVVEWGFTILDGIDPRDSAVPASVAAMSNTHTGSRTLRSPLVSLWRRDGGS